jgi:hypothetical protein
MYNPNRVPGPGPEVLLNFESSFISESIAYYQSKYSDTYHERIRQIILESYQSIASCKVAHILKLKTVVGLNVLESRYLSSEALTSSMLGLIAEEAYISPRLGELKKIKMKDGVLDGVQNTDSATI